MRHVFIAVCLLFFPLVSHAETAFSVGQITARSAVAGARLVLNVHLSETAETCALFVDGKKVRTMTIRDTLATTTYTFNEPGSFGVTADCTTLAGVRGIGSMVTIVVNAANPNAKPGDLIKMACPPTEPTINHPCTTVYYYGFDGRRHAFPSERIYKTWYKDFSNIVVVSPTALSEFSLGRNVTHKPATKLVKFSTPTVYAVSYGGVLRPIASEEIAKALFSANWIAQVEDVSDAFYASYRFGRTIESSRDFETSRIRSAVDGIDDTF